MDEWFLAMLHLLNKQRIHLTTRFYDTDSIKQTADIRKDYLHNVSAEIVKNHDIISVEDLAVKNIMKNHCLARPMSDISLGTFYTMLEYKSNWNDRQFIKLDSFFPSSRTCSSCRWMKQDLTLTIRAWTCESCRGIHDRDVSAAKNILKQDINILSGCGTQSDTNKNLVRRYH